MTRDQLISEIKSKGTYLCVGLDSDIEKIPPHLLSKPDPQFSFNKQIIDATADHCVAYKINTAFYESQGPRGWESMQKTIQYIPSTHFTIADAKRGDIGNTATQYAKAFFKTMNFDAITVAPYMGEDSVKPFLNYEGKWTILLGLTSNPGAQDFEMLSTGELRLYEQVMKKAAEWGNTGNLMFVIGATRADVFGDIRKSYPDHFFLVPGIGAQGGNLKDISLKGLNKDGGLLVNASRAIIFASSTQDFAIAAAREAAIYHDEMRHYLTF
jgi:orotidine-5'-phosphate decarboxylase